MHCLQTSDEGAILDEDDTVGDVLDDRDKVWNLEAGPHFPLILCRICKQTSIFKRRYRVLIAICAYFLLTRSKRYVLF